MNHIEIAHRLLDGHPYIRLYGKLMAEDIGATEPEIGPQILRDLLGVMGARAAPEATDADINRLLAEGAIEAKVQTDANPDYDRDIRTAAVLLRSIREKALASDIQVEYLDPDNPAGPLGGDEFTEAFIALLLRRAVERQIVSRSSEVQTA